MTDQKSPGSVMSHIEFPDPMTEEYLQEHHWPRGDGYTVNQDGDSELLWYADEVIEITNARDAQWRAFLADREKRAQAAQGVPFDPTPEMEDAGMRAITACDEDFQDQEARLDLRVAYRAMIAVATEASKPVQAEAPHVTVRLPGITAKQAAAVSIALCEALVDAGREFGIVLIGEQAEAPSDDADPLTLEQEEWVMDLAEKHNLGRRVPQIGALRGVAPDVFYTDASYRTHELFCFAAELLAAKQAGREPVASIYVSPNGEREFDDWGHDLPVGRNELCLATKQAEAPTASNERMTDEQATALWQKHLRVSDVDGYSIHGGLELVRAVEARAALATQQEAQPQAAHDKIDAERWRFSMRYQKRYEETPQLECEAMNEMWRKVYREHRRAPTREEYEAATDAAIVEERAARAAQQATGERG